MQVKEKLARLIDVKSIITVMVMGVFCALSAAGRIDVQRFMTVATAVITFYFAKQPSSGKKGE